MYSHSALIQDMVKDVHVPRFVWVKQRFETPTVNDIPHEVETQLSRIDFASMIKPGMRIALTAGSRGIANIAIILKEVASIIRKNGGCPFIVPAMGSHGGATAEGQRALIERYGITEASCGCPIVSSMDVKVIGHTDAGHPVYMDKAAAESDGIVVIGRIKAHTDFSGPYESGIAKMIVIGLGKQFGAQAFHSFGCQNYAKNLPIYANVAIRNTPILCGLGIIENACDETAKLVALERNEILAKEPACLIEAKALMGKILFHDIDVLVVDKIGKNISGEGMDPNVTGRFATPYAKGGSDSKCVCVLDLTDESHGAFVGIGMADITTMRLFEKADFESSYVNQLTSTILLPSKMPIVLENDKTAIRACIKYCCCEDLENPRIVRIEDTMHLGRIMISEALIPDAQASDFLEVASKPFHFSFNDQDNLW